MFVMLFMHYEQKLSLHGGNSKDVAFYCANVRALFEEYYMNYLHDDISTGAGKWILENLNIYCPFSGITNNQLESLNT